MRIYTVGHSSLDISKFCKILKSFGIEKIIDVRSYPGSRYVPQFNKETLGDEFKKEGIEYEHFSKLGGRRKSCSIDNTLIEGWKNESFRNYASYTLSDEYEEGINELIEEGKKKTVAIMCAESVPWKCHRLLISNNLTNKGVEVIHIMGEGQSEMHQMNKYGAKTEKREGKIIYPEI